MWFIITRMEISKWANAVIIAMGLLISLYPVLYFTPLGVLHLTYRLSPQFQIYLTSGIVAVLGFIKLIRPGKRG